MLKLNQTRTVGHVNEATNVTWWKLLASFFSQSEPVSRQGTTGIAGCPPALPLFVVTVSSLTETLTELIFLLGRTCSVSVVSKRHKAVESSPSDEDRCHPLCRVSWTGTCFLDKHRVIKTPDCKNYALLKAAWSTEDLSWIAGGSGQA